MFLIVGQNGAGKSSLLEAIVFSLYGVGVRYGKRSPFDYVRSGADQCTVKFSFLRKGKKYEVIRRIRMRDRVSEALLTVNDKIVASQRSLVDEKLKEAMETSYESFISTFLLPQGMVASLLTATRSRINEVVFDVLFEKKKLTKIVEKVSDAFKDAQHERDELLRRINDLNNEIEKIESHIRETPLETLEREIKVLEKELTLKEERLREIEQELQIHRQMESFERMLQAKLEERQNLLRSIEEEKKISTARSLELPYRELLHACESLNRVENALERLRASRTKILQETQRLEQEIEKTRLELSECEGAVQKVQAQIEKLSKIDEQSEPLVQNVSSLKERKMMFEQQLSSKKHELEKARKRIEEKKKEHTELERKLDSLIEQFEKMKPSAIVWMADQIAQQLNDGDRCPVCGGIYSKRKVEELEYDLEGYRKLKDSIDETKEKKAQLFAELQNLSEVAEKLEREVNSLEKELEAVSKEEGRIVQELLQMGYSPQLKKKLREFSAELQKLLERKSILVSQLSKLDGTKQQLHSRLKELDEELENQTKERDVAQEKKQRIEKEFFRALEGINMDFETFKKYVAKELPKFSAQERLSKIEAEIEQLKVQIEQFKRSLKTSKEECQKMAESLRQELQRLKGERDEKIKKKAIVEQSIERRKLLQAQLKELEEKFEQARKLSTVLSLVKDTLAAREFQSYVADLVLRNIVERTNQLLDFLTDGRFSLSIDEDGFVVRDEGVKRDASGLSGGEKTLVSIALAMSIAEEATGEMEAFFIDEGFSSLDSDNKTKVADALKRLEKLNKVIGFVTHEPQFAEYFERKLLVEKGGKLRWI
ncbi:MAG: AAA family ATPase [Thermotoga caldifontis]|uniref:AAA family ATPase n=1 Tax=Thermotoga caldifontis TaxID=1508419 RepID=UPI003C7ECF1D